MALTGVYGACVLYAAPLRELLMRVAHAGLGRARWTESILGYSRGVPLGWLAPASPR